MACDDWRRKMHLLMIRYKSTDVTFTYFKKVMLGIVIPDPVLPSTRPEK